MDEDEKPKGETNGRISQQQFYQRMLGIKDEMLQMERRLSDKIDQIPVHESKINDLNKHVDGLEAEVKDLRKKTYIWDGLNSIGVLIGTILGTVFGRGS